MQPLAARDEVYCHLTARRAVARAALHLGVDSMTTEAVDVMASCLLEYLERLGACTAATAEAAGRTSAHCHVLDAMAAAEMCTSTAVAALHTTATAAALEESTTVDAVTTVHAGQKLQDLGASWKDLAAFCFGPSWNTDPATENESLQRESGVSGGAGGGKVGPSVAMNSSTNDRGWNAPYPDEVPHFPLCSHEVANPHPFADEPAMHRLDTSVAAANASIQAESQDTLAEFPDAAFQPSEWGSLKREAETTDGGVNGGGEVGEKRKALDNDKGERPSKKTKLLDGTAAKRRPSLSSDLPVFYPPMPSHPESRLLVVESTAIDSAVANRMNAPVDPSSSSFKQPTDDDPTRLVRSALVNSYKGSSSISYSYWGSAWSAANDASLQVPAGRPAAADTNSSITIAPLSRASGSRVSRILEGSMDPSSMA